MRSFSEIFSNVVVWGLLTSTVATVVQLRQPEQEVASVQDTQLPDSMRSLDKTPGLLEAVEEGLQRQNTSTHTTEIAQQPRPGNAPRLSEIIREPGEDDDRYNARFNWAMAQAEAVINPWAAYEDATRARNLFKISYYGTIGEPKTDEEKAAFLKAEAEFFSKTNSDPVDPGKIQKQYALEVAKIFYRDFLKRAEKALITEDSDDVNLALRAADVMNEWLQKEADLDPSKDETLRALGKNVDPAAFRSFIQIFRDIQKERQNPKFQTPWQFAQPGVRVASLLGPGITS